MALESGELAIVKEEQNRLKRYLLGQLSEADEQSLELRLLTEADYGEELDIVETELIDQYLNGALSAEERTQFELNCLNTPERKSKLTFATALDKAARESRTSDKQLTPGPPAREQNRTARRVFPPLYLKIAAMALIAFGVGLSVWLFITKGSGGEQGLADLRAAYQKQRLTEARILVTPGVALVLQIDSDPSNVGVPPSH